VEANDVWRLGIGYRDYVVGPVAADTPLLTIAQSFRDLILAAQAGGFITGYTAVANEALDGTVTLTVSNANAGFTLKGASTSAPQGLQHEVVAAGTVTRTTTARDGTTPTPARSRSPGPSR
jgi:hypothetical protein